MKALALIAASVLSLAGMAAPVYATATADEGSYVQHQVDCLGLLFSDPQRHASECGGPFLDVPPPQTDVNKSGKCVYLSDVSPSETMLVAATYCCDYGELTDVSAWIKLPSTGIISDDSTLVAEPLCPPPPP